MSALNGIAWDGFFDDIEPLDGDGSTSVRAKGNSALLHGGESMLGEQFETGNSTVNKLPVGTVFVKVDDRVLEIVELPAKKDFQPGDRVDTPHGPGTVVRLSSQPLTRGVIYVTDSDSVVRSASVDSLDSINW